MTDNTHYKTFSSRATKQKLCFIIFVGHLWLIIYTTKHFQAPPQNKKYVSFKHLIISVTTICVESCFQAWPLNKNIYGVLILTDNMHWMFSSPVTK